MEGIHTHTHTHIHASPILLSARPQSQHNKYLSRDLMAEEFVDSECSSFWTLSTEKKCTI